MTIRTKIKIGISFGIVAILLAFIVLNRDPIEINLIIGTVETSAAVLVIAVFVLGLLLGWLIRSFLQVRKPKTEDS